MKLTFKQFLLESKKRTVMCVCPWPEDKSADFEVTDVKPGESDEDAIKRAQAAYGTANKFYIKDEDDLNESESSKEKLEILRKEYGNIKKIDPASPSYKRLTDFLDARTDQELKDFRDADIKWISSLARNRLIRRGVK